MAIDEFKSCLVRAKCLKILRLNSLSRLCRCGVMVLLLLLGCISVSGQGRKHREWNEHQYESYMSRPSKWLLDRGDRFLLNKLEPDSALMCYTVVAERFRPDMNKNEMRTCLEGYFGRWQTFFFGYGNAPMAMEDLRTATEIASLLGEPSPKLDYFYGVCYMTIGNNVSDLQLYANAMKYFRKSVHEAKRRGDFLTMHRAFDNLMTAAYICDSLQDVLPEKKMVSASDVPNDWRKRQSLEIYKGFDLQAKGDQRGALKSFQRLIDNLPRKTENMRYLCSFYMKRARAEIAVGELDEAKASLDTLLGITYIYDFPDIRQSGLVALQSYYDAKGDDDAVKQTEYHYFSLKDSLMTDRFISSFREVSFMSERNQMQTAMDAVSYRSRQKGWIIALSGILLCCAVIFLVVLKRSNRKLRERSELLYQKMQESLGQPEAWIGATTRTFHSASPQDDMEDTDRGDEGEKYIGSGLTDDNMDELAARIKDFILNSNLVYEAEFSLGKLAESVGSNRKYVSQTINARLNTNFPTLVNQARIREAMRRLDNHREYGDWSLEGIAESVGFRSRSAFSMWFKRITGLSAAEYRKLGEQNDA